MESGGMAHMGIGFGDGENKMVQAAKNAISSPMLETSIDGARAVLINITGGEDISIIEINEAANLIMEAADPDANIIFGAGIDETMGDKVRITVIATGFEKTPFPPREPVKKARDIERERLYGSTYTGSFGAYAGTADFAQDVPSFAQPAMDYSRPSMGVPTPAAPQQPQVYQQPVQQPQNTGAFGTQQFPQQQPFQAAFQPQQQAQQPLMGGATGPMAPQQPVQQPQQDSRGVPVWMKKRNS